MNNEIKFLPPFKRMCMSIGTLPSSFYASMSYYESMVWLYEYLKNEVIPVVNNNSEVAEELQTAFTQLENYIEHYFDTLDIQHEVDVKLDEMAENGTLADMIAEYVRLQGQITYPDVPTMKLAENLQNGSFIKTYGFYSYNDGGGALYKARTITNEDVIDNATIIALHDPTLVAELITENNQLYAKQLGCHLDKNTDDTTLLQHAIDIAYEKNYSLILNGYAYVTTTIETKGVHIIGIGDPADAGQTYTSHEYGYLGWDYLRNTGNGALITFDDYKIDVLTTGSGVISDVADPILQCNYDYGRFFLENICVCGWIRTANQKGIASYLSEDSTLTYVPGTHHLKDINVINCGGTGIYLNSLEMVEVYNVKSKMNFGYGLFIEGITDVLSPFEYVSFDSCNFSGNKLGNIYALNTFRKNIAITNTMFNFTGLYQQLGISIPTTTADIVPAIKISGTEPTDGSTTKENILIYNCYGEDTRVLLHIDQQGKIVNNINMFNNTILPESLHDYYCILYLNASYCDKFNFYSNKFNGSNQIILANITQLKPISVDVSYYNAYNPVATLSFNASINHAVGGNESVFIQRYGNIVQLNATIKATADIAGYQALISNLPKPLYASYIVGLLNDTTPIKLNCYENKTIVSPSAITSGSTITFHMLYFTEYNVDK